MISKRVVGPKGQVVIPKEMRDALGLREGSEVIIEVEEDKVVIRRAKPEYRVESFTEYFVKTHSPKLNEPVNIKKLIEEEVAARWHTSTQMS